MSLLVWLHSDDKDTMRVYINPLESMLNKYGEVRFILSSMYYDMTGIATRHRNIYLDTATFMSGSMTAAVTQPVGTHRILMGANTPYGMLRREVEKLEVLEELTEFPEKPHLLPECETTAETMISPHSLLLAVLSAFDRCQIDGLPLKMCKLVGFWILPPIPRLFGVL